MAKKQKLHLENLKSNGKWFTSLDCYNGDNMGQLEGTAKINGDKATYKQGDNCPVYFTLKGNTVVVKVDDSQILTASTMQVEEYFTTELLRKRIKT